MYFDNDVEIQKDLIPLFHCSAAGKEGKLIMASGPMAPLNVGMT